MKKDFLAGARKKRVSWTPKGLFEAWLDLDAAAKVYVGTVVGLIVSVRTYTFWRSWVVLVLTATVDSSNRTLLRIQTISCLVWHFWSHCRLTRMPQGS